MPHLCRNRVAGSAGVRFACRLILGVSMSFKIAARHGEDPGASSITEHGSHGGLFATVLSAFALVISGLSYYESTLKTADLAVYVPPMIHYARDGRDVFNIPITIANEGARTGTVLNMELEVEKLGPVAADGMKKRRFHAAFLGEYPQGEEKIESRSFAPLAIAGHNTFTQTVRFYPMDSEDGVLIDDKGDFRFTLTLTMAAPPEAGALETLVGKGAAPAPLVFEMTLPYLAIQHLSFRNGTQAMFNKEWKPATSYSPPSRKAAAPEEAAPTQEDAPVPQPQSAPAEAPPKNAEEAPASPTPAPQKIEIIPEQPAAPPPADPKTAGGGQKPQPQPKR